MNYKQISVCQRQIIIACDNKCDKAWGYNSRPYIQLDKNNVDDIVWLSDKELGIAPTNPGIYEGCDAKPKNDSEKMNKWCFRECERCSSHELNEEIKLISFDERKYNIPRREE